MSLAIEETPTPISWGTLSNTCTCEVWNDADNDYARPELCGGECWDDALYSFGLAVEHLLTMTDNFIVVNLRLWNGNVSGTFRANSVSELVRGMTVNSEWTMEYKVYPDSIRYSLSHHDAPTGSSSVLRPIVEEDTED